MVAVGKLTERRRRRKEFCVCGEPFVAGGMEGRQAMIHSCQPWQPIRAGNTLLGTSTEIDISHYHKLYSLNKPNYANCVNQRSFEASIHFWAVPTEELDQSIVVCMH
jgi:hypothetical protein